MEEKEKQLCILLDSIYAYTVDAIEDMNNMQDSCLNQILAKREAQIHLLESLLEAGKSFPSIDGNKTQREILLEGNADKISKISNLDQIMREIAIEKMEEIKSEIKSINKKKIIKNYGQVSKTITNRLDITQ